MELRGRSLIEVMTNKKTNVPAVKVPQCTYGKVAAHYGVCAISVEFSGKCATAAVQQGMIGCHYLLQAAHTTSV